MLKLCYFACLHCEVRVLSIANSGVSSAATKPNMIVGTALRRIKRLLLYKLYFQHVFQLCVRAYTMHCAQVGPL